jgi:hypothetical protein
VRSDKADCYVELQLLDAVLVMLAWINLIIESACIPQRKIRICRISDGAFRAVILNEKSLHFTLRRCNYTTVIP